MPTGVKPINCVGRKGHSGRKSAYDEYVKKAVIDKSWEKLLKMLENPKSNHKELLTIALTIAPRTIKNEVAMTVNKDIEDLTATIKNIDGGKLTEKPNDDISMPKSV